jgi:restriction endonuclease Mrr
MPVPDFQTIMFPLLQQFGDGKEHSIHEVLDNLTQFFSLSEQELLCENSAQRGDVT